MLLGAWHRGASMSGTADDNDWASDQAGRFWAGGVATALVAALIAAAGYAIASGVLGIEVWVPDADGVLGWSQDLFYGVGAAVVALVCAAVLYLLLLAVPRPLTYFRWIMGLIGVTVVAAPFATDVPLASQVTTAVVATVVVVAIATLLTGVSERLRRTSVRRTS